MTDDSGTYWPPTLCSGGKPALFCSPRNPKRCVKIRRPDFTLSDLRRRKGFPKNLKRLSSFDDNREEAEVIEKLQRRHGPELFQHVSHCYGFEETDSGRGLVTELMRDNKGSIASTLKKYLWDQGLTPDCRRAVDQLCSFWEAEGVMSRDLLLHNLVVQRRLDGSVERFVVIDGLGSSSLMPDYLMPARSRRAKARRKTRNLYQRIEHLLSLRQGRFPGERGLLIHDGTGQRP